jgi:hypothetical protein
MKLFVSLVFFSLLFFSSSFSQTTGFIPFEMLKSGHILVNAKVDGIEGKFIFDTGAGITVLTKKFFEKLTNKAPQDGGFTCFRATGERLDIDLYQVRDFELGSYKQPVQIVSYFDFNIPGIDGIISLKLLEQQPFTIDYKKSVIRFETGKSLAALKKTGTVIPVQCDWSRDKALDIFAYFKVNDTLALQMSLDSGAGNDVFRFNTKYLKALGIDVNDTVAVKKYERKSEMNESFVSTIYSVTVKKLAAAANPAINITGIKAQFVDGLIYDGIMYINWLGSQLSIDLPGKQIIVQK